jgi:hypothetical protein
MPAPETRTFSCGADMIIYWTGSLFIFRSKSSQPYVRVHGNLVEAHGYGGGSEERIFKHAKEEQKTLLCTTFVAGACCSVAALIPSWISISDSSYAEYFNCSVVCSHHCPCVATEETGRSKGSGGVGTRWHWILGPERENLRQGPSRIPLPPCLV